MAAALGSCAFGISRVQPTLAAQFEKLKTTSDVYALPPPDQAIVASLGYRAAFADLLFAHVLVSAGLHFEEKRLFEYVGRYIETINALDPKFRDPYRFADTLLTLQSRKAPREAYFVARDILRRGMKEFPYDAELWVTAGQFMAYLAWPYVGDEKEGKAWRLEGARVLARACEMFGDSAEVPQQCIVAAGQLSKAGEKAAVARFLKRVLALSEDPELRARALAYLEAYVGEQERVVAERRLQALEQEWREEMPFVSKDGYLVLGPRLDVAQCAGLGQASLPSCAASWASFLDRREALSAGI